MKAVILSAGQGSRLSPLTDDRPKCLLPVGGDTILACQIKELAACGINDFVVVAGYCAERVEAELARLRSRYLSVRTLFNPFYHVADNLGSCWIAREEMTEDFILVNGDTLFEREIPRRLLAGARWPITLTINRKPAYDDDDMKVVVDGERLCHVGKKLVTGHIDGESIGMSLYRGRGPSLFVQAIDRFMHRPFGLRVWYLKVIDFLAHRGWVGTLAIDGLRWGEVDYPNDLKDAQSLFRAPHPGL